MINAFFDGSCRSVSSQAAYLHDYGQTLRVVGLNLPSVVEAHFALKESGESSLRAGSCSDGRTTIPIPDSFLEEVGSFFCYIFDRGDTSGRTVYKIKIPVLKRADMPTETTEPSEQDVSYFEQVLAQMEALAERAEAAAGAEQFKVTITGTFNSETRVYDYSSDRTRDEVNEAADAGKYVYAYVTNLNTIMPMIASGSVIRFGYCDISEVVSGKVLTCLEYIIRSNNSVTSINEIVNLSAIDNKADKFPVTITKITGDNPSGPTCDKTYLQIMAAVRAGAEIICAYTVKLVYGGEVEQEITQHLQFVRADADNIVFGFYGWGKQMGKDILVAHAVEISRWNSITVYDSGLEIATAANITTLTSRISQLEARVAALEGGN